MSKSDSTNEMLGACVFGAGAVMALAVPGLGASLISPMFMGVAGNLLTDSYKATRDWYASGKSRPDGSSGDHDLKALMVQSIMRVIRAARSEFATDGHQHGRDLLTALCTLTVVHLNAAIDQPQFASLQEGQMLQFIGAPHGGIDERAATGSVWASLLLEAVKLQTPDALVDPDKMTEGQRAGLAFAARSLWSRFPAQFNGDLRDDPARGGRALVAVQSIIFRSIGDRLASAESIAKEHHAQFRTLAAWLVGSADGLSADTAQHVANVDGSLVENVHQLRVLAWTNLARADEALKGVFRTETQLEEIRRIVAGGPKLASLDPPVPDDPGMVYRHRRVPMVCRDSEFEELREFLYSEQSVAWWAWFGAAGMGKSRLAFELCRQIDRTWDGQASGWVAGFLDTQDIEERDWSAWRPAKPTLIVVDYASGKKENVATWVAGVARAAKESRAIVHPVRFLLLDRDVEARWMDSFLGAGEACDWVRSVRYKSRNGSDAVPHRELRPLDHSGVVRAVRAVYSARIARDPTLAGVARPNPEVVAERFGRAKVPLRPLFATLAAECACDGVNIENLSEEQLVRGWLGESFKQWARIAGERDQHTPRAVALRSLAAVATMAQGLPALSGYAEFLVLIRATGAARFLPADEPYLDPFNLVAKCFGTELARHLPPLEPDYFGELFVADHLMASQMTDEARRALIAAAANANPQGLVRFLLFVQRDLPDHAFLKVLRGPDGKIVPDRTGMSPLAWAEAHFALGVEWYGVQIGDRTANLVMAIMAYEAALLVHTRESSPANWAITQSNLGAAWRDLPTGNRAENLTKAIAAYELALTVFRREVSPIQWAMVKHNLGVAWLAMPIGDRTANLTTAIQAFKSVLSIRTRDATPMDWASTQNSLGNALAQLPSGNRAESLTLAIAAMQEALTVYTPGATPREWASTQSNLGAMWRLFPRGNYAECVDRAIAACKAALTVFTKEANPRHWATAQNNLGNAWLSKPSGVRKENVAAAIAAFEAALTVRTREAMPIDWAATQGNLANAWQASLPGDVPGNIAKAIAASEAALTVFTPEAAPMEWATIQNNLGAMWGELPSGDRYDNLTRAIAACRAALTIRTFEGSPVDWANTQCCLAALLAQLAELPTQDRRDLLCRSMECGKAALTVFTSDAYPRENADTNHMLEICARHYEELADVSEER